MLSYTYSSWIGNSHMIDQLAKTILCVPVNLAPPDIPLSDTVAVNSLTGHTEEG